MGAAAGGGAVRELGPGRTLGAGGGGSEPRGPWGRLTGAAARSPRNPSPGRGRDRRGPRSHWRPARGGSQAAACRPRTSGRGRGLCRLPRAPRPGYSDGRQQTSLSPGRERGGPGEARPGAAASAAGGQASCRPSAAPGRSLVPGRPGAGSAVDGGASGRRAAGARAPGPASLSPRARRRAPPRHRVPAGRERLHIRVPPRPGPEREGLRGAPRRERGGKGLGVSRDPGKKEKETDREASPGRRGRAHAPHRDRGDRKPRLPLAVRQEARSAAEGRERRAVRARLLLP